MCAPNGSTGGTSTTASAVIDEPVLGGEPARDVERGVRLDVVGDGNQNRSIADVPRHALDARAGGLAAGLRR